jgi:hypothetical protein
VRAVIPLAVAGASTAGFQNTLIAAILAAVDSPREAVALWREVMGRIRPEYVSGEPVVAATVTGFRA